jgi:hypothetical protein
MLGVGERGYSPTTRTAVDNLRDRLLVTRSTSRPLVYLRPRARQRETGLARSQAMATIDQAGVINVAARLGSGQLTRVTREQIFAWDPAIIIAQQPSFYTALQRDRGWRGLAAVAKKRVYLAPADPFGWIDDPAGVNRVIGLPWLTALFYPDVYQETCDRSASSTTNSMASSWATATQALVAGGSPAGRNPASIDVPFSAQSRCRFPDHHLCLRAAPGPRRPSAEPLPGGPDSNKLFGAFPILHRQTGMDGAAVAEQVNCGASAGIATSASVSVSTRLAVHHRTGRMCRRATKPARWWNTWPLTWLACSEARRRNGAIASARLRRSRPPLPPAGPSASGPNGSSGIRRGQITLTVIPSRRFPSRYVLTRRSRIWPRRNCTARYCRAGRGRRHHDHSPVILLAKQVTAARLMLNWPVRCTSGPPAIPPKHVVEHPVARMPAALKTMCSPPKVSRLLDHRQAVVELSDRAVIRCRIARPP